MPMIQITRLIQQGHDLIMVPLAPDFDRKTRNERSQYLEQIEFAAAMVQMPGIVCLVWESGPRTMYLGPPGYRKVYEAIEFGYALANVNDEVDL